MVAGAGFEPAASGLGADVFHWLLMSAVFRVVLGKNGKRNQFEPSSIVVVFRSFRWVSAGLRHFV